MSGINVDMLKNKLMAAAAALLGFAATALPAHAGATLEGVRQRGILVCGVNVGVAGFSQPDSGGTWRGLDVDFCRATAAAVLGDANKVRYVPLTAVQRFPALQAGEIDLLQRQGTQTLTRDTTLGLRMVGVTFYDGHGFMVKRSANLTSARQLDGGTVCVQSGTTNESITAEYARENNLNIHIVVFDRVVEANNALAAGRCDAVGTDAGQLAALRSMLPNPQDYMILPERLSKEPYGPMVRRDDQEWFEVIRWIVMATVEAEELGLTTANVEQMRTSSESANVRRLLGVDPLLGNSLKLPQDWAFQIIRQVGNYGEIYERNMGVNTPLGLERGANALWTKGGLMYAWPMR